MIRCRIWCQYHVTCKISVTDYEKSHAPDPYVRVLNLSHFLCQRPDSIGKKDNEVGQAENEDNDSCKLSDCRKPAKETVHVGSDLLFVCTSTLR